MVGNGGAMDCRSSPVDAHCDVLFGCLSPPLTLFQLLLGLAVLGQGDVDHLVLQGFMGFRVLGVLGVWGFGGLGVWAFGDLGVLGFW